MKPIRLDGRSLTRAQLVDVAYGAHVELAMDQLPAVARAQRSIIVQGVADAELWKSDVGSVMLTRNAGKPAALGRVNLWGAAELGHDVVVYAAGTAETYPLGVTVR